MNELLNSRSAIAASTTLTLPPQATPSLAKPGGAAGAAAEGGS